MMVVQRALVVVMIWCVKYPTSARKEDIKCSGICTYGTHVRSLLRLYCKRILQAARKIGKVDKIQILGALSAAS